MADTKTGMIQAKELRIGNILKDKLTGALLRVDELTIEGKIVTYVIDRSKYPLPKGWQITPVEISEEILLKCGFEKKVNYVKGMTIKDGIAFFDDNEFGHDKEDEIECKHLHQLQNLYYSLTGQELTINF